MTSRTSGPVVIDTARIAAFAAGIAETARRHGDPRHPQFSAPPLIVAVAIIPGTGCLLSEVGLEPETLVRVVHGGIEIGFDRPIVAGDELNCRATFLGIDDKSSGRLVNIGFNVHDARGARVADGLTRYFIRGEKRGGGVPAVGQDAPGAPTHQVTEIVPAGLSLKYAEGSGDAFPIHTDADFARSVGLPDVILHGMCTLGFATRAVVNATLGGDSARLRRVAVRFSKMVFHGDALTTRIERRGSSASFVTVNQRGETVLTDGLAVLAG